MMEGLQISIPQRMNLVRGILVLSLISCMICSFSLWGGERNFPLATLVGHVRFVPPVDLIWPLLYVLALLSAFVSVSPRFFSFIALVIALWMCLNDVNRLQTWFYAFNAMLLVFVFYDGRVDDSSKYTSHFINLQIIVASVYFFTGLFQFNDHFVTEVFEPLITPLRGILSERQFGMAVQAGRFSPALLMFIGVGLVIGPIRYLAIAFALLVHLLLIILLFPSENHPYYALWASNISFVLLLVFLFSGKTKQRYYSPTFLFQMPVFYFVMVFFVVLPFFNLKGLWPDALSFNMMSGSNRKVAITVSEGLYRNLPLYERHLYQQAGDGWQLDYERWCAEELHAQVFAHDVVFNSIYIYLNSFGNGGVKERELDQGQMSAHFAMPGGNSIFARDLADE